jgi:hypothetical protein
MSLRRAQQFLKNVISKLEIVPFTRFKYGVSRKSQLKTLKISTTGRWPQKSAVILLEILKNAESNAKQNRNVVPLMDEKPAQEIIQNIIPQLEAKEEPAKIVRTLDEVVKEEISETSFESKLENSEESFIQNHQEQENQLKVEFEINLLLTPLLLSQWQISW